MNYSSSYTFDLSDKLIKRTMQNQELNTSLSKEILKNSAFDAIVIFEKKIMLKEKNEELSLLCSIIKDKYSEYKALENNSSNNENKEQYFKIELEYALKKAIKDLESKNKVLQEGIEDMNHAFK